MEWLVILGVFAGLLIIGCVCVWWARTWTSVLVFVLMAAPAVAFGRLVWVVLATESPDPSTGELALPFALAAIDIAIIWGWLYSKEPKATSDATAAVASAYIAGRAVRRYQRMRDRERAEAVADEMKRQGDT
jgi:hypothetical protein